MKCPNYQKVTVLGGGESGTGAALLAASRGIKVCVSDSGRILSAYRNQLSIAGIPFEEGKHTIEKILQADVIVKSPGIPSNIPVLREAAKNKIPVIGEVEFAGYFYSGIVIGITGSNGKSTTATLLNHILQYAGLNAALGGHIGIDFSRLLLDPHPDIAVLELSSFQLEDIQKFPFKYGAILNVTPDHLERYESSFEKYFEAKWQLVTCMNKAGSFVYNFDDPALREAVLERIPEPECYPYSVEKQLEKGGFMQNDEMIIQLNSKNKFSMKYEDVALKGVHNQGNTMAACVIARLLDVRKETIRESLRNFTSLEHRLEKVVRIRGVDFINDSKATNVNAVWYALESMDKPVVWIAGGIDKGNDYTLLEPMVRQKVKGLVALGTDNIKLVNAFAGLVPDLAAAESMEDAVKKAFEMAEKGDVVLLSPACSSFDLFENFMDRGDQFKKCVKNL